MKVAAVQFKPSFKDVAANTKAAAELVIKAAQSGAKLVVLPELCTTGYSFMSADEALPFAEVLGSPGSKPLAASACSMPVMQALSQKLGIAIVWGVLERDIGTGKLHNSQVLVVPDNRYWIARKSNSWGNDYLWATEGQANPPIGEFGGKRIGLLICADIRNKSDQLNELYEPGDADIVAFSSNWGKGGFPSGRWVQFAQKNKVFLVASNRYGEEANNDFGAGGICVIEPCGKVHCEGLQWGRPCIVYADVT